MKFLILYGKKSKYKAEGVEKDKQIGCKLPDEIVTNRWGQTPKLTFHELIKKFRQAHYPVSRWREIAIVYDS